MANLRIITCELDYPDLEFAWADTREQNPREAAQIDVAYVGAGILTPDEVRARLGMQKLPRVVVAAPREKKVSKNNPYHVPAGSERGGQFTTADEAGFGGDAGKLREDQRASLAAMGIDPDNLPGLIERAQNGEEIQTAFAGTMSGLAFLALLAEAGILIYGINQLRQNRNKEPIFSAQEDAGRATEAAQGKEKKKEEGDNEGPGNDPKEPKGNPDLTWEFGNYKSKERWENQMRDRNWTEGDINETIKNGKKYLARNDINKGNLAIRYENLKTGSYLVRDEVTKEIIQLGEPNFIRPPAP